MRLDIGAANVHRRSSKTYLAVGIIGAAFWLVRYAMMYGLHPAQPLNWSGWYDQSLYVRSATAFAHGDLSASSHWYPLLYPLLGSPFARLTPGNPFLLPDMLLFGLMCAGFARSMVRIGVRPGTALAFLILGDLLLKPIARLWLVPWTTNLSAAVIWWLIPLALDVLERRPDEAGQSLRLAAIGLLAALLPLARPTDLTLSVAALSLLIGILAWRGRLRAATLGWIALGGAAPSLAYLALHLAIYGPAETEYARQSVAHGFNFRDMGWKAYIILITPRPWFAEAQSLLERMPWLIPGAAGIALAAWTDRRARLAIGLILAVGLPYTMVVLAYNDLVPSGLWKFNNAHYFKWLFPFFGLGLWIWLKALVTRARAAPAVAALLLLLAPTCLRLIPHAAAEEEPARVLLFRGSPSRDWYEAYTAPAVITDAAGSITNLREFHQIPDAHGQRAIALARPFQSHPAKDDPGESPAYRTGHRPYARYADSLSVGLPCWIARRQCAGGIDW